MEVTSPERTKLLAMIREKDDFKKKLNATKLKCQQSKCKVQKKKSTFRHRFALRFKSLLARDMKTAKSHILKVFLKGSCGSDISNSPQKPKPFQR